MLNTLNQWGGLISLIGLFFSCLVFIWTGNIKKNITRNLEYKTYKQSKHETIKSLKSLIDSLDKDDLKDYAYQSELLIEINKLSRHKGFVDTKSKFKIWRLNHILKKGLTDKNKQEVVWLLSIVLGQLNLDPVQSQNVEE
jgi:hypothetical protein